MLDSIFGLPLHPLVVHATVVLVPLAAILLIASAVSAKVRRWAGLLPLVFAVVAAVMVPITTGSGESLEHRVGEGGLVETHAEMGEQLLPFSIAVAVLAAALWWFSRAERAADPSTGSTGANRTVVMVIVALSVIAGLGSIVQVARIGHSGAQAAWTDVMQTTSPGGGEGSEGGDGD